MPKACRGEAEARPCSQRLHWLGLRLIFIDDDDGNTDTGTKEEETERGGPPPDLCFFYVMTPWKLELRTFSSSEVFFGTK